MLIEKTLVILSLCILLLACGPNNTSKVEREPPPKYVEVINILKNTSDVKPHIPARAPVHTVYNRESVIPPQCYTRTEGEHNPCYVCHQNAIPERENVMNDGHLQAAYSFSDKGLTNHWQNLFEDRTQRIKKISDKEIIQWVNTDNYSELPQRLEKAGHEGWIPDLENLQLGADAFDEFGFAKDGSHWVAFNYKPLPSTFWPTNGSTDDVMIRLHEDYRADKSGKYSLDVYRANLAIVEADIKGLKKISSLPINEQVIGKDLNKDGELSVVEEITDVSDYVGKAEGYFKDTFLYPKNTEFLHTVRYLGVEGDDIKVSTRMKEVRYMRKWKAFRKPIYARHYQLEAYEKDAGNYPGYAHAGDHGLDNGNGWAIAGFIEGRDGRLRVSTFEENFFCMGCHNSVGATIDKTFSFARKLDGKKGWGYINLKGMPDVPTYGESQGEILTYFERVGGGDEFRSNTEMLERWFNEDGSLNREKVKAAKDVYELITPSLDRALALNKAYRVIVEDQDFIFGRDATIKPPMNVYKEVSNETSPTLPSDKQYTWDLRLDWSEQRYDVHAKSEMSPYLIKDQ